VTVKTSRREVEKSRLQVDNFRGGTCQLPPRKFLEAILRQNWSFAPFSARFDTMWGACLHSLPLPRDAVVGGSPWQQGKRVVAMCGRAGGFAGTHRRRKELQSDPAPADLTKRAIGVNLLSPLGESNRLGKHLEKQSCAASCGQMRRKLMQINGMRI
jgi:hypothetical protein